MDKQEEIVEVELVEEEALEAAEEGVKTPEPEEVEEAPRKKERQPSSSQRKKTVPTSLPKPTYVALKSLVYLAVARNSASVAAVQTRLVETGYVEAGGEKRGWFGPLTCQSLVAFQQDEGIEEDYCAGEQTITALFAGTHVEVHDL